MKIVIHFDETSQRPDRGYGVIYWNFEGFQFPEKDWFDFVFLVLSGWNHALYSMISEKRDSCVLTMQDGNSEIRIVKQSSNCDIEFGEYDVYDESFDKNEEQIIKTDFEEILKEVLSKTRFVSDYILKNSLNSDYTIALNNWYEKLKNEVN